jgi:hypothetical protein
VQQTCTIIQIIGNCSNITVVNGSGNVVSTYQEGNCNKETTTPSCPAGTTGTFPKCQGPPTVYNTQTPQEADVKGEQLLCADVSAPAGVKSVTFVTKFGKFGPASKNTAYGEDGYCATYTAPSEAPFGELEEIRPGVEAEVGFDFYWVSVTDNNGVSNEKEEEVEFIPIVKEVNSGGEEVFY